MLKFIVWSSAGSLNHPVGSLQMGCCPEAPILLLVEVGLSKRHPALVRRFQEMEMPLCSSVIGGRC